MTQAEIATQFTDLHVKGKPVVLYNIWDAGGAKTLEEAGAKAIATGSWSVAAAHGFDDGQAIPMDFALSIAERIVQSVGLPLTIDFEGGYADDTDTLAKNIRQLIDTGVVGLNFEDQKIGTTDLYATEQQAKRIQAIRQAADEANVPLFINARTDLFLKEKDKEKHSSLLGDAISRATAYAKVGANGFFVPGLTDKDLIKEICESVALPINVMKLDDTYSIEELASFGVARISFGPVPYFLAMATLAEAFKNI